MGMLSGLWQGLIKTGLNIAKSQARRITNPLYQGYALAALDHGKDVVDVLYDKNTKDGEQLGKVARQFAADDRVKKATMDRIVVAIQQLQNDDLRTAIELLLVPTNKTIDLYLDEDLGNKAQLEIVIEEFLNSSATDEVILALLRMALKSVNDDLKQGILEGVASLLASRGPVDIKL